MEMLRPRAWWLDEAETVERRPAPTPLTHDLAADVAIVGGGYTGLWTALALRARDPALEIVVLEAARIGDGPSGRNGGFLHGYWSSLPRLRAALADEDALALARASSAIVPAVEAFCAERAEDVWLRRGGLLKVSASPAQDESVARSVRAAVELGVPEQAVALSAEEVRSRCASPRFRSGVFFRDGATVQPARLVLALRRAVLAAGVAVNERTPVTRLLPGRTTILETPAARVRAARVVVATNASAASWRPLARRLTTFGSYVVLTEPVPELLAEIGWTGGEAVVDGRMFLHYFRTTADGRVLMGSGSGPVGRGGRLDARFTLDAASAERAERGLRRLLPALTHARVEHAWGGPIDVSSDYLPVVGTLPPGDVHYAAGFSGNGVGPSWLAAQALASLVLGADDEWARLPLVRRRQPLPLPPEPLKYLGARAVRVAALACEEADDDGRTASLRHRAIAAVPRLLRMPLGTR